MHLSFNFKTRVRFSRFLERFIRWFSLEVSFDASNGDDR